jgi:hypothetical protein
LERCGFFPIVGIRVDSTGVAVEVGRDLQNETKESEAIEVEVVEVDGLTQPERTAPAHAGSDRPSRPQWRQWQARAMKLDSRWWPLWVFLGIIAVVILLIFGVVIGIIFVIFRIIRGILNAIFG